MRRWLGRFDKNSKRGMCLPIFMGERSISIAYIGFRNSMDGIDKRSRSVIYGIVFISIHIVPKPPVVNVDTNLEFKITVPSVPASALAKQRKSLAG